MLPALQAVRSCRVLGALAVANDCVWCEHLMAGRAVAFSFGLTLNIRRGTNAVFWNSLFRENFFGDAGLSKAAERGRKGANGRVWGPRCKNLFLGCAITRN